VIKLIDKKHKKELLRIVLEKLDLCENWIVNEHRYYNQYVYDDETCFISIMYSSVYNKIEFINKMRNRYGVYTVSFLDRNKLRKKLNKLMESKMNENIDEILNLNNKSKNQETENGKIE
jgi:hypothetical protein